MPSRRGPLNVSSQRCKLRFQVVTLLVISVVAPLAFMAARFGNFVSAFGHKGFQDGSTNTVIDVIKIKAGDSSSLSFRVLGQNDLSSWVLEKPFHISRGESTIFEKKDSIETVEQLKSDRKLENTDAGYHSRGKIVAVNLGGVSNNSVIDTPSQIGEKQMRIERKEKMLTGLAQQDESVMLQLEKPTIEQTKEIDKAVQGNYIRRPENDANSDFLVRQMHDQLIMAKVYASMANSRNNANLLQDLRLRIKESQRSLGEANVDADLPRSASERIKSMGKTLSKAREQLYDCTAITKKLRAMLHSTEERVHALKKQSTFLNQLVAKTIPKGFHCLSLRLSTEYSMLPKDKREFPDQEKIEDPNLFHYALFSDNVMAAAVVVNSTVLNAKEPKKHVFHLVTDNLNYASMKMWFLANPPGNAAIQIQNLEDFKWLNSSYCPVLQQLESSSLKDYYFRPNHPTTLASGSSNLKYRNPKYLSMLNHLRFYLPEVYPKLHKVLFLDDDVVVQKDLTALWSINLHGKVNGAVETCGQSFHRFDKYLNFSNPMISRNFDPNACGWAYGMNIFDLRSWKQQDITGIYHKWQKMNKDRVLWKLGTLPPGLITFYNLTYPLQKYWHVLGLGYNPAVDRDEIKNASVIHYNGNLKPWLELAMIKYKPYWTKYVNYNHRFLQQCNVNQ